MLNFADAAPSAAADAIEGGAIEGGAVDEGATVAHTSTRLDSFSMKNIADADGYSIAFVGMTIVFFALILVTVFISVLPRLLGHLARVLPEEVTAPEHVPSVRRDDDGSLIAAIGYMIHRRQGGDDR